MSKYKVGDKFIVEIEEIYNGNLAKHEEHMHLYRIKGFNSLVLDEYGLDKLQKYEESKTIKESDQQNAQFLTYLERIARALESNDDHERATYILGYHDALNDFLEACKKEEVSILGLKIEDLERVKRAVFSNF